MGEFQNTSVMRAKGVFSLRKAGTAYDSVGEPSHKFEAVSYKEAIANWNEIVFDKDGNFIGSICGLAVSDAEFDQDTGWKPLNLAYSAQ